MLLANECWMSPAFLRRCFLVNGHERESFHACHKDILAIQLLASTQHHQKSTFHNSKLLKYMILTVGQLICASDFPKHATSARMELSHEIHFAARHRQTLKKRKEAPTYIHVEAHPCRKERPKTIKFSYFTKGGRGGHVKAPF